MADEADTGEQALHDLKRAELALATRKQDLAEREFAARVDDAQAARWRSPLVVAIIAATVAGLSNAAVALVNANAQRTLSAQQAEASRILEVIKTGDPDKAVRNLRFLLDAGLIGAGEQNERLRKFLAAAARGEVAAPSLPAGGNFALDKASDLPADQSAKILTDLGRFAAYLESLGFARPSKPITVRLKRGSHNAFYLGDEATIEIDSDLARDPDVARHPYAVAMIETLARQSGQGGSPVGAAIMYGATDYFIGSYAGRSRIGEISGPLLKPGGGPLRDLAIRRAFATMQPADSAVERGEIWSSLFWAIRGEIGQRAADALIAATLRGAFGVKRETTTAAQFSAALASEAARSGHPGVARLLEERGFPTASSSTNRQIPPAGGSS